MGRFLAIILPVLLSSCSYIEQARQRSEFSGALAGSPANARTAHLDNNLYGSTSHDDDLANSPLNNNVNNTSAVHPYGNVYPRQKRGNETIN